MKTIKWDLFIRCFHWSLVCSVVLAYLSGEFDVEALHSWFGYLICLLIPARILWGFISKGNGRFSAFIYSPAETWAYLISMLKNNPRHYITHNPVGALMVFALIIVISVTAGSGLILEGWGEYEGPLWMMGIQFSDELGYCVKSLHRQFPELLLVLVGFHLMGVIIATFQHKENFVYAMWYGYEKTESKPEKEGEKES